ncbi:MAG: glutamyl-tRNA reductase [Bacillota bacterium]|nr:glutamyl-tRNA reductase [Bacillota bacterium]
MSLVLLGINHKHAGIELREKLSLQKLEVEQILNDLIRQESIEECFLFSTCNRTELYTICQEADVLPGHFLSSLQKVKDSEIDGKLLDICYTLEEEEAVNHLFRVASGLDSMVIGETQILGQVKDAYYHCSENSSTGVYLHSLCQKALSAGKKIHTQTALGQHAVSFGYAAAELAKKLFTSLENQTLLVIGTGEMAKLTLQNLFELGAGEIIVATRRRKRGEALAGMFQGKTINLTRLDEGLTNADVIICATNAPHYVITKEKLLPHLDGTRSLLVIDLGVPRNVEPEVGALEGVYLYNLDDIEKIIEGNIRNREAEALKAEVIIKEQVNSFVRWYHRQRVIPLITSLRRKTEETRQKKLEQFADKLSSLSPKEQETIDKLSRSLANDLIRDTIINMKDLSLGSDYEEAEKYIQKILGLE